MAVLVTIILLGITLELSGATPSHRTAKVVIYDKEETLTIQATNYAFGANYLIVYDEYGTRYVTNQDYLVIERGS